MGNIRSQQGFSLVELMVVVGIIGILATIAVPNFNRYLENGKKGEAKVTLSTIYTRLEMYRTEYNGYTTCLGTGLGYKPDGYVAGQGFPNSYYRHGFAQVGLAPAGATGCTAGEGETYFTPSGFIAQQAPDSSGSRWASLLIPEAHAQLCTTCGTGGSVPLLPSTSFNLAAKTYTLSAEGRIGPNYSGTNLSIFTIDQSKNLVEAH